MLDLGSRSIITHNTPDTTTATIWTAASVKYSVCMRAALLAEYRASSALEDFGIGEPHQLPFAGGDVVFEADRGHAPLGKGDRAGRHAQQGRRQVVDVGRMSHPGDRHVGVRVRPVEQVFES